MLASTVKVMHTVIREIFVVIVIIDYVTVIMIVLSTVGGVSLPIETYTRPYLGG